MDAEKSVPTPLQQQLRHMAQHARHAARPLARANAEQRTQALIAIADALHAQRDGITAANQRDLAQAKAAGLSAPMVDRLDLSGNRLIQLEQSVRDIAQQRDPVGEITRAWDRPNGLKVEKVRLPLGVILMIYESRPNVTIDAAALCIRSGNAVILRGGSEAWHTNQALMQVVHAGLRQAGLPEHAAQLVPTLERDAIDYLVQLDQYIDLCIPRGGESLIRRVCERSRIPVVQHYKGVCHVYVDAHADLTMALNIIDNAKTQRPGVCNALETVLIHQAIAPRFVPMLIERLQSKGVTLRGCAQTCQISPHVQHAAESDWDTEFLDLILAIKVVNDVDDAIAHIDQHGTQHTAAIVTNHAATADRFTRYVDASCVLVNASTRFNDGGALGLGAEMGISTTRVHAYGPMGAEALCSERFVVHGDGQIRV